MSKHLFSITSHIIPAAHIRGLNRGVQDDQNGQLRLAVKHYVPKNRQAQLGEPTLIIAHGIGTPKECHEPFLDDLLAHLPIRGAWACDVTTHSASYVLNEHLLGDEPHWLDSARDMIHMVNMFAAQMPPPIYGIGQSWGCANIVMMSHIHQRLFAGMILMEPFWGTEHEFQTYRKAGQGTAQADHRISLLARRHDTWPTRAEAAAKLRATPYYAGYDARVFARVVEYGLRDAPTPTHPLAVTLTTPKAQEVYLYARPDPPLPGYDASPDYKDRPAESFVVPGFYSAEVKHRVRVLGQIQPPVLFMWGTESDIGGSSYPQIVVGQAGVGDEGNGGVAAGKVQSVHIKGARHTIHMDMPGKAAEAVSEWLRKELKDRHNEMARKRKQPPFNPGLLNPLWRERLSKL